MPRGRRTHFSEDDEWRSRPAMSPERRENQLIAMAYDLVEKRIREGTASAQEVTHFLKLGSTKERLEKEIMAEQKKLMSAKTDSITSSKKFEQLYTDAMEMFKTYSGHGDETYED